MRTRLLACLLGTLLGGCSLITDFDRFQGGGDDDDDDTAEAPRGTSVTATVGTVENAQYRLRVSVGAPQPMGAASNETRQARVGGTPR